MSWNDDERWNDDELNNRITTNGFVVEPFDIDNGPTDPTAGIGEDISLLGRIDQYEILKELGTGGFGSVYLARDTVSRTFVAVKGLPALVKNNAEEMERIRDNFALVSRLHHPNIAAALVLHPANSVSYFDSAVAEKLNVKSGNTLMVMEYAPGVTLTKWRRQFPGCKVPIDKAIEITRQIADAMDYAHQRKIIHRDIKPSNVMVETYEDGTFTARVLDFGLAAEVRSSMNRVSQEKENMAGTREYMSPEQWKGRDLGFATDQYALAVLFYELIVGKVPFLSAFECGDPIVAMVAATTQPPEFPEELPGAVCAALAKALAKKQKDRFATCGDFVRAISRPESGIELEDSAEKHLRQSSPEGGLRSNEDFGLVRDSVSRNLGLEGKNHPEDQVVRDWYDQASLPRRILEYIRVYGAMTVVGSCLFFAQNSGYSGLSSSMRKCFVCLYVICWCLLIGKSSLIAVIKFFSKLLFGEFAVDLKILLTEALRLLAGVMLLYTCGTFVFFTGAAALALFDLVPLQPWIQDWVKRLYDWSYWVVFGPCIIGGMRLGTLLLMKRHVRANQKAIWKWCVISIVTFVTFFLFNKSSSFKKWQCRASNVEEAIRAFEMKDYEKAWKLVERANGSDVRLIAHIADAYYLGNMGVSVNYEKAITNYKKLLGNINESKEPTLYYCIGQCYKKLGVYYEALSWFNKAAAAGCEKAYLMLGEFYEVGNLDVKCNKTKALLAYSHVSNSKNAEIKASAEKAIGRLTKKPLREQHICALATNILANYSGTTADDSGYDRVDAKSINSVNGLIDDSHEYTEYVVQHGDYLAKIAKKFGVTITGIKKMNPWIKNDAVSIGQKIKIPDVASAVCMYGVKTNVTHKSFVPYAGQTKEHVVVSGSSLASIAYDNGITIRQLKELNGLKSDALRVGQTLLVPASEKGSRFTPAPPVAVDDSDARRDEVEAFRRYCKSAEQGNAVAQYNLGCFYYKGEGVKQDYAKAMEWYCKAAEQGHAKAQYNVGCCYYKGEGVKQDYAKAMEWYRRAAKLGLAEAQQVLRKRNLTWE